MDRALEIASQDPDNFLIDESISQMITFKLNRFFESIDLDRKKYTSLPVKIVTPNTRFRYRSITTSFTSPPVFIY